MVFSNQLFFSLFALWAAVKGSTVRFSASPSSLVAGLSTAASMRCDVSNGYNASEPSYASTASDVRHVTSIFITKNGVDDVASVTSYDAPAALTDPGNLQVKGSLSAISGEGYIELTWADASRVALGEYTCTVGAVDARGHIVQLTRALDITASPPGLPDLMNAFKDLSMKLNNQQQTINQQQQTINKLTQDNINQQTTISKLSNASTTAAQPVCACPSSSPSQNPQQQQPLPSSLTPSQLTDLNKISACTSARVAFTARLATGSHSYAEDQNVVYTDLLTNDPGDYSANTGVFTVSRAGIYLLELHAMGDKDQEAALDLKVNGRRLTSLDVYDTKEDKNSASTSAVYHLKAGDQVVVVANDDSLLDQDKDTHGNSFSGVLIHSDACL